MSENAFRVGAMLGDCVGKKKRCIEQHRSVQKLLGINSNERTNVYVQRNDAKYSSLDIRHPPDIREEPV